MWSLDLVLGGSVLVDFLLVFDFVEVLWSDLSLLELNEEVGSYLELELEMERYKVLLEDEDGFE